MRATTKALVSLGLTLGLFLGAPAVQASDSSGLARAAAVRKVTYPGQGVNVYRASGQLHRLHATSHVFRAFVKKRLNRLFAGTGSDPKCAQSPLVNVKRWRSDGYARGSEGVFRKCPGGGYAVIYVRRDGKWRLGLGSQDLFSCEKLYKFQVPFKIADPTCIDKNGEVQAYEPGL